MSACKSAIRSALAAVLLLAGRAGAEPPAAAQLPDGSYTIENRKSGLFLAVSERSTEERAPIIQWTHESADEWMLKQRGDGSTSLQNKRSGLYLTLARHTPG